MCACLTNASCLNASTLIEKLRNFHLNSFWQKKLRRYRYLLFSPNHFHNQWSNLFFRVWQKLFNYEINIPARQVFPIRYGECMIAPITSAIINCPIYIKTHKLWKLCELSISIFCHVNTCHQKDLSFKTQIYKEIESSSHILALFCYKLLPPPPIVFDK